MNGPAGTWETLDEAGPGFLQGRHVPIAAEKPGDAVPVQLAVFAVFFTAAIGFMMILNVPYHSFKGLDLRGRVPFIVMILIMVIFGIVLLDPARVLLAVAVVYALSGPVMAVRNKLRGSSSIPKGPP